MSCDESDHRINRNTTLKVASAMLAACASGIGVTDFRPRDTSPRVTPSRNQSPRVKGSRRNEICPCCGKKRKHCVNGGVTP